MDKDNWILDLEETKKKGEGLGLRVWNLNKKSYLRGVVVPWTQRTLESNTPPLKSNQSGVYAITELDRFLPSGDTTGGPLKVYGIVKWGGRWQYHGLENVVRANKASIVHLWVSERLARADEEIPVFLSSYYRVPVDTYTGTEDLRRQILESLHSYESAPPKTFSNVEDWLEFQKERQETTHKDPTGSYGSRSLRKAELEAIRVFNLKDEHSKKRDEYHSSGLFPSETVYVYKVLLDGKNARGTLSFLGANSIKEAMDLVNSTKESCYILLSRYKIENKFLSIPIDMESLVLLPSEALYKVDGLGKVTRVKNFMQDFEVMRVSEEDVPIKEIMDLLEDKVDSTNRNSEVLKVLNPESPSNIVRVPESVKPFLSKKSNKWVDQTWEGSDLNKRLLVFGYILVKAGVTYSDLVAYSPDFLPEEELGKYTIDYNSGIIRGPEGFLDIHSAQAALTKWKQRERYKIGLED